MVYYGKATTDLFTIQQGGAGVEKGGKKGWESGNYLISNQKLPLSSPFIKGVFMDVLLSNGMTALVDDCDWHRVMKRLWHCRRVSGRWVAFTDLKEGDVVAEVSMQRYILGVKPGVDIEYLDGNGLNNQRSNLVAVLHREKLRLRAGGARTKPYFDGRQRNRPWRVVLSGKYHGSFQTLEEAQEYIDTHYLKREEALVARPARKVNRENPHRSTVWRRKKLAALKESC